MNFTAKYFEELTTKELYEILKARAAIFIAEQGINCIDMDGVDYESLHCFFFENGRVTAYLRAFYQDEENKSTVIIGRVLTLHHGNGTGRELMEKSLAAIRLKMKCEKICLHAQKYAVGFYEKFGFEVVSDEFLEEGIVHVTMELAL